MRRHVIVGRFGAGDKIKIPKAADEVVSSIDLLVSEKQLGYGIGAASNDLSKLHVFPTEIGLDLLVLAAHVYAADTRISRITESQDSWTREIRLVIPVSDVQRWITVTPLLKRILNFLTGDRWDFGFRSRPPKFAVMVPEKPVQLVGSAFDVVSLFSGGLDSLIGAIDLLEAGRTPLLVSHAAEGAVSSSQEQCFEGLKSHYKKSNFDRLRVWMGFDNDLVKGVGAESTTRGRSFLFFALGAFAGSGLDSPFVLKVPENGLIALNVPLDPLRLGALSTRTTHPFYISRWNELLSLVGISGRIENPYWNKTKGEMVRECMNRSLLKELVPCSMSCSSPAKARWQGQRAGHCGYCLPCLIRRAALAPDDPTSYSFTDLHARTIDCLQAEGQQIRSFMFAIARLQSRPDLAGLFIHKPGPLSDNPERLADLAGVYKRGLEEVGRLIAGVKVGPG